MGEKRGWRRAAECLRERSTDSRGVVWGERLATDSQCVGRECVGRGRQGGHEGCRAHGRWLGARGA
eukprot:282600-Chlamydomonas_euryale.AAC.2